MKSLTALAAAALCLLSLSACDAIGVYKLDNDLPPIMDSVTQYPFITSVEVEKPDGSLVALTSSEDINTIRMKFEGIKCLKDDMDDDTLMYTVTFITTDVPFSIEIYSDDEIMTGGVYYEIERGGVDLFYLEGLFN